MSGQTKDMYTIKTVETALMFLDALGEEEGEFNLTCLTGKLGLNKNHVFRLLATFEKWGYVERIKSSANYRVGLSAYEIGQKFLSRMNLLTRSKPVMEGLAREGDETVYLAMPAGPDCLLLDKVDTTNPVGIMPLVGRRFPLSHCAAGKVILAFTEAAHSVHAKKGLELTAELDVTAIRQNGFSVDVGGMGDGIASLAVPLLNGKKAALGCLCFVGPQYRFTDERVRGCLLPRLKAAGQVVSSQFGYVDYHFA